MKAYLRSIGPLFLVLGLPILPMMGTTIDRRPLPAPEELSRPEITITGRIVGPKSATFREGDIIELRGELVWNGVEEPGDVFLRLWIGDQAKHSTIAWEAKEKVFDVMRSTNKSGRAKWRGKLTFNSDVLINYLIEVTPRNQHRKIYELNEKRISWTKNISRTQ